MTLAVPADWQEGQQLRIQKVDDESPVEDIDHDFAVLAALCESSDPAEEEQFDQALQEARQLAKEPVRRHVGSA